MRLYNEFSGVEFDAWFESNPGEPTIPPTVHYRLRCETNDQTVIDWTSVPYEIISADDGISGVRAHIEIPGSANQILNAANRREVRDLQVVAAKDQDREYSDSIQYYVVSKGRR